MPFEARLCLRCDISGSHGYRYEDDLPLEHWAVNLVEIDRYFIGTYCLQDQDDVCSNYYLNMGKTLPDCTAHRSGKAIFMSVFFYVVSSCAGRYLTIG